LIRGTKEKSEGDVFHGHHLHQIPLLDRFADRLSLINTDADRVHCVYNLGTDMLKQHARSAASCMVILEQNRRNRRLLSLFPYLLIYRTEEVEGSYPARSTKLP